MSLLNHLILLAVSLPFLWVGVLLSIKRLRSAQFPLWLVVLFVVPILKLFLFVALALAPEKGTVPANPGVRLTWLPESLLGSAALALLVSCSIMMAAAFMGTHLLGDYGWGLFAGLPFSTGFLSALILGARKRRTVRESLLVAVVSIALSGAIFLVVAFEGVICLIMAAPIAFVLAMLGALAAHVILNFSRPKPELFCVPIIAMPLMLGIEYFRAEPPPLLKVVTSIEIKARPEAVWKQVVSFNELPEPRDFIFKVGIAYPIRAEILGKGPGAIRNCIFSTGPFVEPIEVWDEPRLLKFSVTHNPEPLQEWTPYRAIHPPHLNGFLVSKQGQFRLEPLPNGHTLLEGTTWYHHTMWPANYWQIWSDKIIHTIHLRVLNHVKNLAEKAE